MSTQSILPDIQIHFTAHDHVAAYERLLHSACIQLTHASTPELRMDAQQWIDSAERQLLRWRAVAARQAVQR